MSSQRFTKWGVVAGLLAVAALAGKQAAKAASKAASKRSVSSTAAASAEAKRKIQRICVFCGSSPGKKPVYMEAARKFGQEMVRTPRNPFPSLTLVFAG